MWDILAICLAQCILFTTIHIIVHAHTHTDLTNTLLLGINDLTNGPIQQTHDANMLNRFNWKSKRENYNRMHMLQHMEAQAANNKWDADADAEVTIFSAKNTWTDADTDPKVTIFFC